MEEYFNWYNLYMNNNANNFQGLDPNQLSKMMNFKTEAKYKYSLLILLTTIPFLIFLLVLGNDSGYSDGAIWGVSMGMFVFNIIAVFLLTKFTNIIKNDMYPAIFAHTWFWVAWYGLYMIGWWRILVSLIFYIIFYIIGIVLAIILTLYQQKKKFDSVLRGISGENPEMYEEILKQQQTASSPFMNVNNNASEDLLKNLDEELRKQGIDIDSLDEQFGTFLNKDEATKDISPDDLKNFTSEEEIIEAIYNDDGQQEEIILNKETIDETEDDSKESKKIIDQ